MTRKLFRISVGGHFKTVQRSQQMALRALQELRNQQAAALAYFDVFWSSAVVAALLVFLVLLMRRSVAEKGTHIGAE